MDKKDILIIISLFSIAFIIRAMGVSNSPLYIDEWVYMWKTRLILVNSWIPVAEVFDRSPPFLSHIGALITVIFGGELTNIRMISVVFGSLNVPMLYLFGKTIYDRKTGFLSALFLMFSPFHVLYSHIYMIEALELFFIISFLYFFWLSKQASGKKSVIYSIVAGAMMGLAFDAKYISLFLIPTIIGVVLWVNKFNFKALLNKKIILVFIFAILFFLPLVTILLYTGVGFHGFAYFAYERFDSGSVKRNTVAAPYMYSLGDIIVKGVGKILDVFAWGNNAGVFIPPWNFIFQFSTILLLLMTTVSCLRNFLKRDEKSCFLIISVFMLVILIFFSGNTRHYWIYSFPFFYVMFSHLAIESKGHLSAKDHKSIFRALIILLTVITLLFYFVSTATSSEWDRGDYHPWIKSVVNYIESDIIRNGYEEKNVLIGNVMTIDIMVNYQLFLDKSNLSTIGLLEPGDEYSGEFAALNLERIETSKPTYIIVPDTFYNIYFTDQVKKEVFQDYRIIFHSKDYPTGCFVLKRKNLQLTELQIPSGSMEGEISHDMFKKSVPSVMKVGEVYKAIVQVKNNKNTRRIFTVRLETEDFILFVEDNQRVLTLDGYSISNLEFRMVPLEKNVGELPINVDLYVEYEENGKPIIRKVDSVKDYIYNIETERYT